MGVHPVRCAIPVREWLQALSTESNTVIAEPAEVERLEAAECLDCAAAIQMTGQSLFRFSLAPPASGETDGLWRISYRQLMIQSF